MVVPADICLSVEGLSKKFARSLTQAMVYGAYDLGRALVGRTEQAALRAGEFWALSNVTFQLRQGRSIGVIGPNGSGKTTLMRLIAGVLTPSTGAVHAQGRIAPMLALGAGFKPVLSGRENIALNLSLLGVPYSEILERVDDIIAFAEIGEAIDAPIGTYSSGMVARLGFACAVHTDPQILIVDEVLAVGDARFRAKCRNRINQLRKSGTAMLLVSHSSILIQALCDECLYLKRGTVVAHGAPDRVLGLYESDIVQGLASDNSTRASEFSRSDRSLPNVSARILEVRFASSSNGEEGVWATGKPGDMVLVLGCLRPINDASVNVMITDMTRQAGETVQFMTSYRDIGWLRLDPGRPVLCLTLPAVGLRSGTYRVKVSVSQGVMHDVLDVIEDVELIVRDAGLETNGLYFQPRDWTITGGSVSESARVPAGAQVEASEKR